MGILYCAEKRVCVADLWEGRQRRQKGPPPRTVSLDSACPFNPQAFSPQIILLLTSQPLETPFPLSFQIP